MQGKGSTKYPTESQVEMTELVLPQHTNSFGTIFGGVILSWVDIAAAICAQRHSERPVVTASIDAMHFLAPIRLGWIVNIKASVNYSSNSSCEVGVRITAENPMTKELNHTATAYVTMVSLDSHGRPVSMPKLVPQSSEEIRRMNEAQDRRKQRLDLKQKITESRKLKGEA